MGPLKDALHTAVWTHLWATPRCQTLLTSLNHPVSGSQTVRASWSELKNGRTEGVKKSTGLQAVLAERPDIFVFQTTERGHQLIGLTENARVVGPNDTGGVLPAMPAEMAAAAAAGSPPEVGVPGAPGTGKKKKKSGSGGGVVIEAPDGSAASDLLAEERPSKSQKTGKGKGKGSMWGGNWNGWCYTDIVWTPEMQQKRDSEKQKEDQLVRALYRAMEMHGSKSVTLSQLGSDFKVAELKKDPYFKNWRLLDIIKEYENVFELLPATGVTGGMMVNLQPGAGAALPDADIVAEQVNEAELMLPERIDDPRGTKEKIQALRIELLYALQRRGGSTAIQELGQEPRVQKVKSGLHAAKKLIDWIRIFPDNFKVTAVDNAQMIVEINSTEVNDQSMIDRTLFRSEQDRMGSYSKGGRKQHYQPPPPRTPSHSSSGMSQLQNAYLSLFSGQAGFAPSSHLGSLGYGPPGTPAPPQMQAPQVSGFDAAASVSALLQAAGRGYGGFAQYPPTAYVPQPGYAMPPPQPGFPG